MPDHSNSERCPTCKRKRDKPRIRRLWMEASPCPDSFHDQSDGEGGQSFQVRSVPGISGGAALIGWARAQDPILRVRAGESLESVALDFDLDSGHLEVLCNLIDDVLGGEGGAEGGKAYGDTLSNAPQVADSGPSLAAENERLREALRQANNTLEDSWPHAGCTPDADLMADVAKQIRGALDRETE